MCFSLRAAFCGCVAAPSLHDEPASLALSPRITPPPTKSAERLHIGPQRERFLLSTLAFATYLLLCGRGPVLFHNDPEKMSVTGEIDISKLNTQQLEQLHKQTEAVRYRRGFRGSRKDRTEDAVVAIGLSLEDRDLDLCVLTPISSLSVCSAGSQEPDYVPPTAPSGAGEVPRVIQLPECDSCGRRG